MAPLIYFLIYSRLCLFILYITNVFSQVVVCLFHFFSTQKFVLLLLFQFAFVSVDHDFENTVLSTVALVYLNSIQFLFLLFIVNLNDLNTVVNSEPT